MKKINLGKLLWRFPREFVKMCITYLPGELGFELRTWFWQKRLKHLGNEVTIDVGVYFQNPQHISLEDHCWIDRNVIILAGPPGGQRITYTKNNPDFSLDPGAVVIGKDTHIAPNCVLSGIGGIYIGKNCGVASHSAIYSYSHHYRNLSDKQDSFQYTFSPRVRVDQQSMICGPIVIEDYCAIGLSSVILPGVTIKTGSWIASGSIITESCDPQTLTYFDQGKKQKSLANLTIKE